MYTAYSRLHTLTISAGELHLHAGLRGAPDVQVAGLRAGVRPTW